MDKLTLRLDLLDEPLVLSERSAEILESASYRAARVRHVKLGVYSLIGGFVGALTSYWFLIQQSPAAQAALFSLLCLILSLGLFGVAAFTLLGSWAENFAMQRFAHAEKDIEIFEADNEKNEMLRAVNAVNAMMREISDKVRSQDLTQDSLDVIVTSYSAENRFEDAPILQWRRLAREWLNAGASPDHVKAFEPPHGKSS